LRGSEEFFDGVEQVGNAERFRKERLRAGAEALLDVAGASAGAEQKDWHRLSRGGGTESREYRESVEARQLDVEYHQVRLKFGDSFRAGLPITEALNRVSGVSQQQLEQHAGVGVVSDDGDLHGAACAMRALPMFWRIDRASLGFRA
jgi:hypothetical protein